MSRPHRNTRSLRLDDPLFAVKRRKTVPHEFVLEAVAALSPRTHPMFGCLAVYVEDKIVLILRDKRDKTEDNGGWLATAEEHHESLRREFPNMRSVQVLGKKVTGLQVLPVDAPDFEEAALRAIPEYRFPRSSCYWSLGTDSKLVSSREGTCQSAFPYRFLGLQTVQAESQCSATLLIPAVSLLASTGHRQTRQLWILLPGPIASRLY